MFFDEVDHANDLVNRHTMGCVLSNPLL